MTAARSDGPALPVPTSPPVPSPAQTRAALATKTSGEAFALEVRGDALAFCDDRGAHILDLHTSVISSTQAACPKKTEPNSACTSLPLDVSVETPRGGPLDVIYVAGQALHPRGRVRDCAADGSHLVVATAGGVETFDVKTGAAHLIEETTGAGRATVGAGWVAWEQGSEVRAVHQ